MTTEKKERENQKRDDLPEMRVGDTVKVHYRFIEKDKDRVQAFEGIVIARKGSGISETMTIRGLVAGEMMEKVIPVHSPNLQKVETIKRDRARKAKLYYLRNVAGKKVKLKRRVEKPTLKKEG